MDHIISKRIPVKETSKCNQLYCTLSYNLGGVNYFSGRMERRGYYVGITPERNNGNATVSFSFSYAGYKQCIIECNRASKKKANEAEQWFNEHLHELIEAWFPELEVLE